MSTNKVTSPPVETGSALTSLKKMGSTYQFDATAAAFQPASLKIHPSNQPNFPRIRPTRWRVQCKWTLACVDNCRYGRKCLWGHEGDEYLDEPGVKHTFKSEIDHDQTRYDQVAFYNPGEYSTYSTSGYSVQQNSNYGIHQYVNGSMPDFSWVDGAANVDGCLDMKNYPVFEYADTQVQDPAGFYGDTSVFDPENIYGDGHTESQSGNQVGTSTGSIKKKKKHNKKFKKAAAKPIGDMIERAGMDGMALTKEQLQNVQARGAHFEMDGGQIEKQLQDLQIKDAGFGKSLEKTAVSATDDKTAI
ncbi:hypothetical protein Q9L58_008506 [Maublancomyces gigas]|uniref:C3H1-type domain-containing protein n=1 Tax=Discina gigas TaxID=1032678 RepID=A0ABR3G9J7_9PEZI